LPLVGAWFESTKLNVNLIGATISLKLQNSSSFFAILEVLLEIHDSIVVNFDEIVELLYSQFDPQGDPPQEEHKLIVDGIGNKHCKKSYDNSRKF
jgi:hypothetical protein